MPRLTFFVACPYLLFPLDDYKKTFQAVAKAYDVAFTFADEQITNKHVLAKITEYIRKSDISLFDITGWNANVALEFGIAVGLNRPYLILFNPKLDPNKDAPSDIKGIDRIQYTSNSELEAKLILAVKQHLPSAAEPVNAFDAIKARIEEHLVSSPNQSLAQVATALGEDKTLVQSVLRSMTASGALITSGAKKGMKYSVAPTPAAASA